MDGWLEALSQLIAGSTRPRQQCSSEARYRQVDAVGVVWPGVRDPERAHCEQAEGEAEAAEHREAARHQQVASPAAPATQCLRRPSTRQT